jgi:hypothetical protein
MATSVSSSLPLSTWGQPLGEDINQKIAFALMAQQFGQKPEIRSHWQGAAELGNSALAGMMYRKAQDEALGATRTQGDITFGPGSSPPPQSGGFGGVLGGIGKAVGGLFGGGDAAPSAPPVQTASLPPPATDAAPDKPNYGGIASALADKQTPPTPPATIPPPEASLSDGSSVPLPTPNPLGPMDPQFRQQFADLRSAAADRGVNFNAPPVGSLSSRRTQEQQDALYAQGRTAPGPIVTGTRHSNHLSGRALDVVPVDGTTERQVGQTVSDLMQNDPRFAGMRSGANFSNLYDPLHVELNRPGIPSALAALQQQQQPPQQASAQPPQDNSGSVLSYAPLADPTQTRGSWFGNAPGGFNDPSNGSATASGVPTSQPGIALPSRAGLSPGAPQFQVTAPNGQSAVLPQTDVGPAKWTGRGVDITGGAAPQLGYGPNNFPTDSRFQVQPVVPLPPQRPQAAQQVASNDPGFMPQQPPQMPPMGGMGAPGAPPAPPPQPSFADRFNAINSPAAQPTQQAQNMIPLPPPRPQEGPPGYFSQPPVGPNGMFGGNQIPVNPDSMVPSGQGVLPPGVLPQPRPPEAPQGQQGAIPAPYQVAQNGPPVPPPQQMAQAQPQQRPQQPQQQFTSPYYQQAQDQFNRAQKEYWAARAQNNRAAMQAAEAAGQQARGILMQPPQFTSIGTDAFGNPIHGFVSPTQMKVFDLSGHPVQGGTPTAGGGATPLSPFGAETGKPLGTGDAYLNSFVPPDLQQLIRKVASYQIDPSKLAVAKGLKDRVFASAAQFDPTYDQGMYSARASAMKEFNAGGPNSPAGVITSGNTALSHLSHIYDDSEKMGGVNNAGILNAPANWIHQGYMAAEQDPTYKQYNAGTSKFVEEATKFYRGVGGNESDLQRDLADLSAANSPDARRAVIRRMAEFMKSKVDALQSRWHTAMGNTGWMQSVGQPGSDFPVVQTKGQEAYDKIMGRGSESNQPQAQGGQPQAPQQQSQQQGQFSPPQNWQFSPSRQQYRDQQGNIYDKNGNPVR